MASRKVTGGKYLEVEVRSGEVEIYGDFFMHPESEIDNVETLVSEKLNDDVDGIEEAINEFMDDCGVELHGASARDVAELAVEARKND